MNGWIEWTVNANSFYCILLTIIDIQKNHVIYGKYLGLMRPVFNWPRSVNYCKQTVVLTPFFCLQNAIKIVERRRKTNNIREHSPSSVRQEKNINLNYCLFKSSTRIMQAHRWADNISRMNVLTQLKLRKENPSEKKTLSCGDNESQ